MIHTGKKHLEIAVEIEVEDLKKLTIELRGSLCELWSKVESKA
jgi:hypothetical protein